MDKDKVRARQLRLAVIVNLYKQSELTESEAKELLAAPLSPDDWNTFVDDSYLLDNPKAIEIMEAEITRGSNETA